MTALIESWSGTAWSAAPSPQPGHRALYGVSCTSAARCTAVGVSYVNTANATTPLVESWNGTSWSVTPGPGPVGSELVGVSCVSRTACTAVGQYGVGSSAPLIESWNGTNWTIVPSPNRNDSGVLNGVSCASLTSCVAVGTYFSGTNVANKTLTESWNGTRWSAGPSSKGQSELFGASCVSVTDCWAVGRSWGPGRQYQNLHRALERHRLGHRAYPERGARLLLQQPGCRIVRPGPRLRSCW